MAVALETTWDGLSVSQELPFGVTVLVYRRTKEMQLEVLLLHRAHHGPDYEGDWAWTPPSGCRLPNEPILDCAKRELYEECGLSHTAEPTDHGTEEWHWFRVEAAHDASIQLIDPEHDRYEWVSVQEAVQRCEPAVVKTSLRAALTAISST